MQPGSLTDLNKDLCLDQLMNQAAKFRYMFGGKATCPMVLRTTYGAGMNAASQHSQSLHPLVTAIPGLKVAMPSTPADAKGPLHLRALTALQLLIPV